MTTQWHQAFDGLEKAPLIAEELGNSQEAKRFGARLATWAREGETIGFVGPLGAGKTTIIQGMVQALSDGAWRATSPTYALVQVYECQPEVIHMDLYRLEGFAELETIGYWDYVESRRGICVVEWIDQITGAWPGRGAVVKVERQGDSHRAELWGDARWASRVNETRIEV